MIQFLNVQFLFIRKASKKMLRIALAVMDLTNIMLKNKVVVPLAKFILNGVFVDLAFSFVNRLTAASTADYLGTPIDTSSFYSLNGLKIANWVKKKISELPMVDGETFQKAIIFIKRWSKTRRIYSTNFCFLNGISLIFMLLRVVQVSLVNILRYGSTYTR